VESVRFYVDLYKEGAPMGFLNVGGGLAVDYDGSHTDSPSSSNYSLDEYAADIVEVVMDVTRGENVPHPVIVTEAGRATVAHHSVLLFNILDVSRFKLPALPELPANALPVLVNLRQVNDALNKRNMQECYHDAVYYRDEARAGFEHGDVTLRERALAERMFWHIASRIARDIRGLRNVPQELKGLDTALADLYHSNFSVFQSLPDSWAIRHLFPIMPIHRLPEPPLHQATLADITCDCDGRIDHFIDFQDVKRTLPLHELNGSDYVLGVFLVGAYQETLGDLHNLFGDTNVVGVRIGQGGLIEYDCEIAGDTVADVLTYVEYDPPEMIERMRKMAEQAVLPGRITPQERRQIMVAYENGLRGYTYFES
jgi:arginine decarboxylase